MANCVLQVLMALTLNGILAAWASHHASKLQPGGWAAVALMGCVLLSMLAVTVKEAAEEWKELQDGRKATSKNEITTIKTTKTKKA